MSEDCLLQIATYFSDKLRAARQDQVQDGKILLTINNNVSVVPYFYILPKKDGQNRSLVAK